MPYQRKTIDRSTRQAGFTLYEIIVVLIITAVLGMVAFPRLDTSRYRADSVVQNIRSTLQQAQRYALVRQHDVIVSFDTAGGAVKIGMDANNDQVIESGELLLTKSIESGNRFKTAPSGVNGAVSFPIVGAGLRTMNGMPTVTFHRDGSLSTDLEIYITVPGKATAYVYRAITVVQSTGHTDWYRWNPQSSKWQASSL